MGRKPAPQPLSLGETTRPSNDSRQTDTGLRSARLPPDTASPRSPRSAVRYGPSQADIASGEPKPLADVLHQPQQSLPVEHQDEQRRRRPDDSGYDPPPQPSPRDRPLENQQQQQQQQQKQHNHYQRQQPPPPPPPQQQQQQPQQQPGHRHPRRGEDKASKSGFFFNFGKGAKTSDRPVVHQHSNSRSEVMSRDSDRQALSQQSTKQSDSSQQDEPALKPNTPLPNKSEVSLASTADSDSPGNSTSSSKKSKPKPFNLLGRSRSTKDKDGKESKDDKEGKDGKENKDSPSPRDHVQPVAPAPVKVAEPKRPSTAVAAPKTAPLQTRDRSFREMMSSAVRNHSAERSQNRDGGGKGKGQENQQKDHASSSSSSSSYTPTPGAAFFSNLKHSRAAGMLSNRFFGSSRHEPPPPKEPVVDDEHYVLKVINLPLVEQTRLTRISKRLEDSRDKTEFWMPAFPWRAIDYLNYKGSEVEGLYRVPGSGPQIKKWQRKFDEELDVDLFEQPDLYDINIVGSMLKAWLRELPDELFPKEAQERIARECAGAEKVPDLLVEELSQLPPFNYYLLFAITCHLSLLLAHSDKNKMDFRNLCICFQPCMKIDSFCFKFLVCDWRDCWKGCKNEAKYIEDEYALFNEPPPKGISSGSKKPSSSSTGDEDKRETRTASSSDSSKSPNRGASEQKGRVKRKPLAETESAETSSTVSTTVTVGSEREATPAMTGDLRPLSPIKPLSPLNL
ncbi:uncharacterized protein P884DRAFT_270986 [Thermothelomyces heterothallicus CBS 202.75]|uniref:uncharacterized protein n=1 Tax=Thermothelomyces heterothallicus CBS 202.75 TaxID=1149848 RepID=UPI00374315EE